MNSKKYIPSIITGFGAAVLSTIPEIRSLICCLIVPGAAFFALYLYNKTMGNNQPIKLNRAISYGLITGLVAAFFTSIFDIIITFLTHSNELVTGLSQTEDFMRQFKLGPFMDASMKLMEEMVKEIKSTGFSALYAVMITISNFFVFSIFGILGALVGMAILNRRNRPQI
jgi:hypothetical protein